MSDYLTPVLLAVVGLIAGAAAFLEWFILPALRRQHAEELGVRGALLVEGDQGLTFSDLRMATGIEARSLHRRIATLQARGVIVKRAKAVSGAACHWRYFLNVHDQATDAALRTLAVEIRAALRCLYDDDTAYTWLATPQRAFAYRIPSQMIAAGDGDDVLAFLRRATEAVFA